MHCIYHRQIEEVLIEKEEVISRTFTNRDLQQQVQHSRSSSAKRPLKQSSNTEHTWKPTTKWFPSVQSVSSKVQMGSSLKVVECLTNW